MKILIDADGCPVTRLTCDISKKYNIECIIITDTSHIFNIEGIKTVTVSKGNDSVDLKLVNMIEKGDIVITQDYGLAAMCLAKRAVILNQNGIIYDDSNILSMLSTRHISKMARMKGERISGPSKRDKKYDDIFKEKLEEILRKI